MGVRPEIVFRHTEVLDRRIETPVPDLTTRFYVSFNINRSRQKGIRTTHSKENWDHHQGLGWGTSSVHKYTCVGDEGGSYTRTGVYVYGAKGG